MINNHFARFQLPGNLLNTKKMCSLFSWQHAISYLFFSEFFSESEKFQKIQIWGQFGDILGIWRRL
jgi:hypothetical protein